MTLNLAHGRKERPHRLIRRRRTVEVNLDHVAEVLLREAPDVVALQEADGPSVWSGNFDHVDYLARKAGYPHSIRGEQVKSRVLRYGTAILSRIAVESSESITFPPSFPTTYKGCVLVHLRLPGDAGTAVDVLSLHLDFLRASVREKQIQQVIELLAPRPHPLIVMGDFNCEWDGGEATLEALVRRSGLKAYLPDADDLHTYPSKLKRLDWILISEEFSFLSHKILPDVISDHQGVIAELSRVPVAGGERC